jgi:5-methylcytosine-specific restriction enzyme B
VELFDRLADVFIQHASDDMLDLLPGQAYYLARNEDEFKKRLRYDLLPLSKSTFDRAFSGRWRRSSIR